MMSNTEIKFSEISIYLTSWVTDVIVSSASGYFNINKIFRRNSTDITKPGFRPLARGYEQD